jgi:hypothetical protein
MTTQQPNSNSSYSFPSTLNLLEVHLRQVKLKTPENIIDKYSISQIKKLLITAYEITKTGNPMALLEFAKNPCGEYRAKTSEQDLKKITSQHSLLHNEFYVLFDMQNFKHVHVDEKIIDILGLEPADFNLPAMAGLDQSNNLFHRDDYLHVIRWACVGYIALSAPIFTWNSNQDIYRVNFRAGTKKSKIQEIRDTNYVCLEKNCVIICYDHGNKRAVPTYHFDKWTVLPSDYFKYVQPRFLSTPSREQAINGFLCLLNILLLDIPIKYIVMLQAKMEGKNNAMATKILNSKIEKYSKNTYRYTEKQITDSIQKTIRLRIEQCFNQCDKREKHERVRCKTDNDAIELARKMGILPIPPAIEQLIFQLCTSTDKTRIIK